MRDRSDTQKRGEAEKKKGTRGKEPRLQIWKGRTLAHYLPAIVPYPGRGISGDPCLPRAAGRERGLAGRGGWGWGQVVYLGFAHVLLGPLQLQPEVGGIWAALEGVQLDPEDALHLQSLPLHPGLRFGLHHEPFLRRRVAPGQEHGCPAAPGRRAPTVSTESQRGRRPSRVWEEPRPRPLLQAARPQPQPGPPGSRTHRPRPRRRSARVPSLLAAAPATISSCQGLQLGVGLLGLPPPFPPPPASPLHHCASPCRMNPSSICLVA